jgi:hypothetical protein
MVLVYVTGVPAVGRSVVRGELRACGFAAYGTDPLVLRAVTELLANL